MSDLAQMIACLGPEGSFSHEFALSHFGNDCQFQCIDGDFAEVIGKVGDGTSSYAVVPFLNSNGVDVRPAQIALGQKADVSRDQEQLLVCLTCPTEHCYKQAISEFAAARFPLKFSSLKGDFSEEMPCFLQFENTGRPQDLETLLAVQHRHLIGAYPTKHSFSACIAAFFDEEY